MTDHSSLVANVLLFAGILRRCGLSVHTGRLIDALQAMAWVGVAVRADVHATLRALLVHRHEDLQRFDRAFDLFWRAHQTRAGRPSLLALGERPRVRANKGGQSKLDDDDEPAGRTTPAVRLAAGAYSAVDVSRVKDFAELTPEELARAETALRDLGWHLGLRRTRRWGSASHGTIDFRRIFSRNVKHGGELLDLPRRDVVDKPRPIVVLADVSGSMERYSRVLLHFVCGLAQGTRRVESFLFATRLTRVTREAAARGATNAVARLSRSVQDWGGGTRIGECLRAFNVKWTRRVMRNGPVVLIVSDGWDRGDPELLAGELARVRRASRRLIWLNPLLGSNSYEPLTRGMQTALRHVDDFMPVHNLASLERLALHLRALPSWRSKAPTRSTHP